MVNRYLDTPNDLDRNNRNTVIAALNPLVADAFALFVKTKNYHWHASGSHYRDYHLLFDEHAEQIFAMIDVLAERVRKIGGTTIHSVGEISRLQSVVDDDSDFVEPRTMLKNLMEENKNFTKRLRDAHHVADKAEDCATTSVLEIFIDETERRTWFLFETYSHE